MSTYQRILVLVDLTPASRMLVTRAQALAGDAQLHLMHVVEYLPMESLGETVLPAVQLEGELIKNARLRMDKLATEMGLQAPAQIVVGGMLKNELQQNAQRLGIDLIVVGSHSRHGLKALLNFTEDEVLHAAPCDVLAVHLPDRKS